MTFKVKTKGQIEGENLAVPKLRFKEFDNNWNLITLKSLMDFKNGINAPKDAYGKGIKYISVTDILNNNFITYEKIKGLVDIDSTTLENNSVTYGDVLFQRSSETIEDIGKSNVYLDDNKMATFGGFVIRGKKKGTYNPLFINYLLQNNSSRKSIIVKGAGAQHYNISQEELEKIKVYFTTIAEQEKIGNFLSLLDNKIELRQQKIEVLKIYKKGLLQNLKSNSQNWTEYKIRNLFDITRGQVIPKTNLKDNPTGDYIYPVYSSQTSNYGILGYDNTYDFDGKFLTWTTDGANAGKVFYRNGKFRCTNVCGLLYSNKNNNYINLLMADLLNYETPKHVSYVGNPKLMNNVMADIKIKLPSLEVQNKISNIFSIFNNKLFVEEQKLNNLNKIKKSLLQQMFI